MKKFIEYFKAWTYKEEAIAVILFIAGFLFANYKLSQMYPDSGQFFNAPSQFETTLYKVLNFVLILVMPWLGIRIALPKVYRFLRDEVYHRFRELPFETKLDWGLKFILTLLICASLIMSGRAGTREQLTKQLYVQLNVREITPNSSPEIDRYLQSVGVKIPAPWCVAFVSWNLSQLNIPNPKSAWSPNYALKKDIIWTPKQPNKPPMAGDVFTLYYSHLKRVGHGGFFIKEDKSGYFITIEGNTNGAGSREGDGVYLKKRDPQKIYAISRYIKP